MVRLPHIIDYLPIEPAHTNIKYKKEFLDLLYEGCRRFNGSNTSQEASCIALDIDPSFAHLEENKAMFRELNNITNILRECVRRIDEGGEYASQQAVVLEHQGLLLRYARAADANGACGCEVYIRRVIAQLIWEHLRAVDRKSSE